MNALRQRLWLCFPPLTLFSLDVGLTLLGQPADYWKGDYASVLEANPPARWLLLQNPLLFLAVAIGWAIFFCTVLLLWRNPLSQLLSFLLTVGHALGAASWLVRHGLLGWIMAVGMLICAERMWSRCRARQAPGLPNEGGSS